jgi:hypothetical protein
LLSAILALPAALCASATGVSPVTVTVSSFEPARISKATRATPRDVTLIWVVETTSPGRVAVTV